jgi:hypothetical protein
MIVDGKILDGRSFSKDSTLTRVSKAIRTGSI